jgi:hypothetical protein
MHPAVPQIMFGLLCIVVGILIVKALGNDLGWFAFVFGLAVASRGGILLSQSGEKEIGN